MNTLFKLLVVSLKLTVFHPRKLVTTWRCYREVVRFEAKHKRPPNRREAGYATAPHLVRLVGREQFVDAMAKRYMRGQVGDMDLGALEWLRDNSKVSA